MRHKLTIEADGDTLAATIDAAEEAMRLLRDDFTSGHDRNESSSFTFTVTEERG